MTLLRRQPTAFALLVVLAAASLTGCARDRGEDTSPALGRTQQGTPAGGASGAPSPSAEWLATKNTQRIPLADTPALGAAVAHAVYPVTRPPAVALADADDWRAGLVGSVLMAPPLRAPLLFTREGEIPGDTRAALDRLRPAGAPAAAGAQAIRLGTAGDPGNGLRTASVAGADPYTLAANVDEYRARVARRYSASVIVVPADDPGYAMPAAAWAAKSGDPILFASRRVLPGPTRRALRAHDRPRIYLLGPRSAVSRGVEAELGKLGTVTRITGATPQSTAIAFARFADGPFGWGVVDPGHGLVFANPGRPQDAGAVAPLSASGAYGPLVLVRDDGTLGPSLRGYLADIRPGYSSDPVRGVYNRGWIIGDRDAVTAGAQAEIDELLEIAPVNQSGQQR
jgi:putative cell wall binding repeat protein